MTDPARNLFSAAVPVGLFAALALALDQATKFYMVHVVMQPPQLIPVTPFFNLTLGFNNGVSFGMFGNLMQGRPWVMIVLTGAITAMLAGWALTRPSRVERVGLGLIVGGALGNIIDRIRQGAVTDFLDFYWRGWHWPTFNMADVAIFTGAMFLIASELRRREGRQTARTTNG